MFVGNCPARGRMLMGNESIRGLVNIEPGVIVTRWACPCGQTHLTAGGSVASRDARKAAAAVDAVRRSLLGG